MCRARRPVPGSAAAPLTHLGLPSDFPVFKPAPKACGPPDEDCQLDPLVDYEAIEPAPAAD